MTFTTPAVKLLLRFRKEWLVVKAKELDLPTNGTKLILAQKIAEKQEKEQSRIWDAIANPKKEEK